MSKVHAVGYHKEPEDQHLEDILSLGHTISPNFAGESSHKSAPQSRDTPKPHILACSENRLMESLHDNPVT